MPRVDRPPAFARLGLAVLLAVLCLALAAQGLFTHLLQRAPVFGPDWTPQRAEAYGWLAGSVDPLLVKYGHALRHDRFRYGLFGSSRAMGISHSHLGLPEEAFFNFSTGSTGLRQSVALIQALHDAGKAPQTVLVTLDNHDIGYFRHLEWPTVFVDPAYHLEYLRDEATAGAGAVTLVRAVAEVAAYGLRDVVTGFNVERLHRLWMFAQGMEVVSPNLFRPDGSRDMEALGRTPPPFTTYSAPWPAMVAGMKADIARLGRIAASGVRVIVFETPIAPHLAAEVLARRDPATIRLRSEIQEACRQHGVTCVPPPEPLEADRDLIWTSCCHAPPFILARYLAGLL